MKILQARSRQTVLQVSVKSVLLFLGDFLLRVPELSVIMPVFSPLLSSEVKNLLIKEYHKIKTQTSGFNVDGSLCKILTFTLVDEAQKFDLDHFISQVAPIRTRFKINFAVSYVLNEETGPRYYHQSHNNSRLLPTAFVISGPEDLMLSRKSFYVETGWI